MKNLYFIDAVQKLKEKSLSKTDWYLLFSAAAYGCLELRLTFDFWTGFFIAAVIITIFMFIHAENIWESVQKAPFALQAVSFLSAVGVCWRGQMYSYRTWSSFAFFQSFSDSFGVTADFPFTISIVIALAAFGFVYVCTVFLLRKVWNIVNTSVISDRLTVAEIVVYAVFFILTIRFMVGEFLASNAFYGGHFDVIYTSDSPRLDEYSAYLSLTNGENDLRQPLFAVFSSPFAGIPYLICKIISVNVSIQAVLMNSMQIVLLFFSNILIAKAMKLQPAQRICFIVFTCSTYTYLLFVLMMDQYIIAFFWLSFFFYQVCAEDTVDSVALYAAGGTLVTSMAFLPFLSSKSLTKDFKGWLTDLIKNGMGFLILMFAFFRFDIIYSFNSKINDLIRFTGESVSWENKLCQYVSFIKNYFLAPCAGMMDNSSWQLQNITEINCTGTVLLFLAVIGFILNKEKKSSRIAGFWILCSAVILLFFGWGTAENGLNLYGLYFGWAFLVLLFQLAEKIGNWLRLKYFAPVVSISAALALLAVNVPAIQAMAGFAAEHYPV